MHLPNHIRLADINQHPQGGSLLWVPCNCYSPLRAGLAGQPTGAEAARSSPLWSTPTAHPVLLMRAARRTEALVGADTNYYRHRVDAWASSADEGRGNAAISLG